MRLPAFLSSVLMAMLAASLLGAQPPTQGRVIAGATQRILSERERPAVINRVLQERLHTLLPTLMRETGFDMWLVINREYVEDPVYLTLVPEPVFHARRLSMLVFFDRGPEKGVERLTVSRYPSPASTPRRGTAAPRRAVEAAGRNHRGAQPEEDRHQHEPPVVVRRRPVTPGCTRADGRARARADAARRRAPRSCASAGSRRARRLELDLYAHIVAIARGVVSEAFSSRVITPGVTTTDDVAWYIRQRFTDLGLATWFVPTVDRQRAGADVRRRTAVLRRRRRDRARRRAALRRRHHLPASEHRHAGDGLRAATGEDESPDGLKKALADRQPLAGSADRQFATGRTGDEVFARTHAAAKRGGHRAQHVHAPSGLPRPRGGPSIGMWDNQGAGTGDAARWPIAPNTAYAIEGNIKVAVPEWNGRRCRSSSNRRRSSTERRAVYAAGRQTTWHLVR